MVVEVPCIRNSEVVRPLLRIYDPYQRQRRLQALRDELTSEGKSKMVEQHSAGRHLGRLLVARQHL